MRMMDTRHSAQDVCQQIETFLDSKKALDMIRIDLTDKSAMADFMVITSGTSARQVQSMAQLLKEHLHQMGIKPILLEGMETGDWVLLDAGDIIVHLFRPEVRAFYSLEQIWSLSPADMALEAARAVRVE